MCTHEDRCMCISVYVHICRYILIYAPPTPATISHNRKCEACGLGGFLVCCSTCNLVYHPNKCGLPLNQVPAGDWSCWFCVVEGLIPSTPADKEAAKKVVKLINNMKARAKAAETPLLSSESQQVIDSFSALVQSANHPEIISIMKQLSLDNTMSKLELAMDTLGIEKTPETSTDSKSPTHPPKKIMPAYPLNENAWGYRKMRYYKEKVIKALSGCGNFEQQRLVLHHVLLDPKVINVATSIGTNIKEAHLNRTIVGNMRRYLEHANISNRGPGRIANNKRAALNVICAAVVGTPPRGPTI